MPNRDAHALQPKLAGEAQGRTQADAPMLTPAMPTVQARVPPSGSLVQRQKLGRRKLLVMAPQMLIFVGCMPSPKSRISATSKGSTLRTASMALPSGATHFIEPSSADSFSAQVDEEGQEKRASTQRTALGRGEQANRSPAPVVLLMQVWE